MARGRCSGCGHEDQSAKKVERHTASCPEYIRLWREHPERALSPEAEAERWAAHTSTEEYTEQREAAKDEKYAGYRADNERRVEAQASRWKSREFRSGRSTSTPAKLPAQQGGRLAPTGVTLTTNDPDPARRVAARQQEIRVGYAEATLTQDN